MVHAFPSSIDVPHFAQAKRVQNEPDDQKAIPHPRAGFFGVIDERFDTALISQVAGLRPDIQFVFLGPVVKIDPAILPQGKNVHYLGAKSYAELPNYLSGWDVALLPFALNESTRFISPTKTPEYLRRRGKPRGLDADPRRDIRLRRCRAGGDRWHTRGVCESARRSIAASSQAAGRLPSKRSSQRGHGIAPGSRCGKRFEAVRVGSAQLSVSGRQAFRLPTIPTSRRPRPVREESYDYLVVGAGFAGGVLAERLSNGMGKRVLLIDKRDHIGGNTYDYCERRWHPGAQVRPTHLPHQLRGCDAVPLRASPSGATMSTASSRRSMASYCSVPINIDTIEGLYGLSLDADGMQAFLASRAETGREIRTSEDIVLSRVGRELYEKFFRNYTRKQWGLDPSELDASVAGRIPVRLNRDDRYFTDTFQAMPRQGYTRMFERMLDAKRITIRTGLDYSEVARSYPNAKIVFTGPVDEFFGYRFGELPYRSLEFRHETYERECFQPAPVVNYPNDHAYTRITEFKYLTGQVAPKTSVVYEYPKAEGDPYYPHPAPGKHGSLCPIQRACRSTARRPLRRTSRDLSVLQHGSGCGAGAHNL